MVETQRRRLHKVRNASLLANNSVSGSEVRTKLLSDTLKNSHHTIHTATSCLIRKIAILSTPSKMSRFCAIVDYIVLIGGGTTSRRSLPRAM